MSDKLSDKLADEPKKYYAKPDPMASMAPASILEPKTERQSRIEFVRTHTPINAQGLALDPTLFIDDEDIGNPDLDFRWGDLDTPHQIVRHQEPIARGGDGFTPYIKRDGRDVKTGRGPATDVAGKEVVIGRTVQSSGMQLLVRTRTAKEAASQRQDRKSVV